MKSILLTGVIALCAVAPLWGLSTGQGHPSSLWPRRPEAIAKARSLIEQQALDEALVMLAPHLKERGIGGREARLMAAAINVPRYLSRQNPHGFVYAVEPGDNLMRIAKRQRCSLDLVYLLNGILQPSSLQVGQKLVVAPMQLRVEIHCRDRELCVWDGEALVAAYPLSDIADSAKENENLTLGARLGYQASRRVGQHSPLYPSSDRVLRLSNGALIAAGQDFVKAKAIYRMDQRDLNELSYLLSDATDFVILRQDEEADAAAVSQR